MSYQTSAGGTRVDYLEDHNGPALLVPVPDLIIQSDAASTVGWGVNCPSLMKLVYKQAEEDKAWKGVLKKFPTERLEKRKVEGEHHQPPGSKRRLARVCFKGPGVPRVGSSRLPTPKPPRGKESKDRNLACIKTPLQPAKIQYLLTDTCPINVIKTTTLASVLPASRPATGNVT